MHAAARPSQAAQAGESAGWGSGVARPATAERFRGWSCFTSHLPPEIPRPAPRGVLRAAVGRSSDSWTRKASAFLLARRFPRSVPQCQWRVRFHIPLRGSAGMGSSEPYRLPFSSSGVAAGTDRHNIVGCHLSVNTKCSVKPKMLSTATVSRLAMAASLFERPMGPTPLLYELTRSKHIPRATDRPQREILSRELGSFLPQAMDDDFQAMWIEVMNVMGEAGDEVFA